MTSRPAIGVVVPTYNRPVELAATLRTLAEQRMPVARFEVVVSDDGSGDHTADVVRSFSSRLNIRYSWQPDEGFRAGAARNAGARLVSAPVLAFVDSGIRVGPDFLEAHLTAHETAATDRPAMVIGYTWGTTDAYNPGGPPADVRAMLDRYPPAKVVAKLRNRTGFQDLRHPHFELVGFDLDRLAAPWTFVWSSNMSVRAADFARAGGFDEEYRGWGIEDFDLAYRLLADGVRPVLARDAWGVESAHARDGSANQVSAARNAARFADRHPTPDGELLSIWAADGRHEHPEKVFGHLRRWRTRARGTVVGDEIRTALAGVTGGRVLIVGCGATTSLPPGPAYVLADYDADLLAAADPQARHVRHHRLGARLPEPDGSADLVVVTSRLSCFWDRYGPYVHTEARRIGRSVTVFATGSRAVFSC